MMAVLEVMSTCPLTVEPATLVGDLLALFDRHDFNAFPVLDQRGELLGIVSKLDVLELLLAAGRSGAAPDRLGTAQVESLMHSNMVLEAREPISEAGPLWWRRTWAASRWSSGERAAPSLGW
jgi:CBS domain-containing protein